MMSEDTKLITIPNDDLKALVANLPPNKRAAFSKAAKAACQHLRDSKANYSKAYELASAMVENWWLLGLELPTLIQHGGNKQVPQGDVVLGDLGINANQSARCQKLAEMSKVQLDQWLESKYDDAKYYLPSLRPASEYLISARTGQPEWYTPQIYIEAARKVLGGIDLDPASSDIAQKNVKATLYYTLADDGLECGWGGRVWLNPPYASGAIDKFMAKLRLHLEGKEVSAAITLTNNATDTDWFQKAVHLTSAICFVLGRIRFLDEDCDATGAPLQGQILMYFGKAPRRFCQEFKQFGLSEAGTWT